MYRATNCIGWLVLCMWLVRSVSLKPLEKLDEFKEIVFLLPDCSDHANSGMQLTKLTNCFEHDDKMWLIWMSSFWHTFMFLKHFCFNIMFTNILLTDLLGECLISFYFYTVWCNSSTKSRNGQTWPTFRPKWDKKLIT